MKSLFKAIFSSFKKEKELRSLDSLAELQIKDYIRLNDSFALPAELRGKTFQVESIDSYFYGESLSIEWALQGDTKKKLYLSLSDLGDENKIVLSYQLKKKEVENIFGWENIKKQYNPDFEEKLICKDISLFDGWLCKSYDRRECAGKGSYFSGDYRNKTRPQGGEDLTYFELFDEDENFSIDIEMWSKDEVDVFISILRPESDIHEFWAV